jgi:hypothetical protein
MATYPPVIINSEFIKQIKEIYINTPFVRKAINDFKIHAIKAGLSIKGKFFGNWRLKTDDPRIEKYLKYEIGPRLEEIFVEWLIYGLSVVKMAACEDFPELATLVVVPQEFVTIKMYFTEFLTVKFAAYSTEGNRDKMRDPFRDDEQQIPLSIVSVMNRPHLDGRVDSALATAVQRIQAQRRLWYYYMQGSYNSISPPFLWTQENTGSELTGKGGLETVTASTKIIASGGLGNMSIEDVRENSTSRDIKKRQEELRTAEADRAERFTPTTQRFAGDVLSQRARGNQEQLFVSSEIRSYERFDPTTNAYIAPPGQHLEMPPPVRGPEDFVQAQDSIVKEFLASLNLDVDTVATGRMSERSMDIVNQRLQDRVTEFQNRAIPLYEKILEMLFSRLFIDEIIAEQARIDREKLGLDTNDDDESTTLKDPDSDSDDWEGDYDVPTKKFNTGSSLTFDRHAKKLQAKTGLLVGGPGKSSTIYNVNAGTAQIKDPIEERRKQELKALMMSQRPMITVKFNFNPMVSFATLTEALECGVLDPEAYVDMTAAMFRFRDKDLRQNARAFIEKRIDPELLKPASASSSSSSKQKTKKKKTKKTKEPGSKKTKEPSSKKTKKPSTKQSPAKRQKKSSS